MLLPYLKAFLTGGMICAGSQVLIDRTGLTPARILSAYVVSGLVLGALGIYGPFAEWAGAGATVPLTGFGNLLATGTKKAVSEHGLMGALSGPLTAGAAGIMAALLAALAVSFFTKPKSK